MKTLTINQQKSTAPYWKDEAGREIPFKRISSYERLAERTTAKIAAKGLKLHTELTEFKQSIRDEALSLYKAFCAENNGVIGKGKGSATFFNFDRSIKFEVVVNEAITFDPNTIELAKVKLDELLSDGLGGAKEWVKELVMDAFQTSRGKLDPKKILGLRRHAERINDPRYDEVMKLIDKGIRKPKSKEYFRVWVMGENGQYYDLQLNISAIELNT